MVHCGMGIGWPVSGLIARSSRDVFIVVGHACTHTTCVISRPLEGPVPERKWHDLFFRVHATPH